MSHFLQLAPMQALTDVPFMNTYHSVFGGFNEMMAPYIQADSNSPTKVQNLKRLFRDLNPEITLVPQLLSNDAKGFVYFANTLYDLGYAKINWNLGCPFPAVAKKQRGSGLLLYPEKINTILNEIVPQLKPELSIKIRFGYHEPDEIYGLLAIFNQYHIDEIIIHARTAVQKYDGVADASFFKQIYPLIKAPAVYNGDILRAEQVIEAQKNMTELKGFMIGRGAFINPFITQQINGVTLMENQKRRLYADFYSRLAGYYRTTLPETRYLGRMKLLWSYFSKSFSDSEHIEAKLKTLHRIDEFESIAASIIANTPFIY